MDWDGDGNWRLLNRVFATLVGSCKRGVPDWVRNAFFSRACHKGRAWAREAECKKSAAVLNI